MNNLIVNDSQLTNVIFVVNNIPFFHSHRGYLIDCFEKRGFVVNVLAINRENRFIIVRFLNVLFQVNRAVFFNKVGESHFFLISPMVHVLCLLPVYISRSRITIVSTGLGYLGTSAPNLLRTFYFWVLRRYAVFGASAIVQNQDDYCFFKSKLKFNKVDLVRGTYVSKSKNKMRYNWDNEHVKLKLVCVSRLYRDKGILDFVKLHSCYPEVAEFVHITLFGPVDKKNPASFSDEEWFSIINCPILKYEGSVSNDMVHQILATDKFAFGILPSYREGMSRFLVECAIYGLPIITTNAAGCIDFEKLGLAKSYRSGDIEDMFVVLKSLNEMKYSDYNEWSNLCAEMSGNVFSKEKICEGYFENVKI